MSVEAVCFDLDDTLYPYRRYARAGLRAAAERLEIRTGESFHEELVGLYFGRDVTEGTFDALVDRHGLPPDLVGELVEAFHGAADCLEPYPETEAVLDALRDAYRLGVVTDGRGGREKLARLGLEGYFDAVLVTHPTAYSKRDPDVFSRTLEALSSRPGRALHVGDDPRVDFRAANELGLATVRLRRGRYVDLEAESAAAEPDAEIRRLDELPDLVDRLDDR